MSDADLTDIIHMEIPHGRVVIRLRPDVAPNHCEQIRTLVRQFIFSNSKRDLYGN